MQSHREDQQLPLPLKTRTMPLKACRKCRTKLSGMTYLQLGVLLGKGSNALCIDCVDKYILRYKSDTVRSFVNQYLAEFKPDTVHSLKQRLAELEQQIEVLTRPTDK